MLTYIAAIGVLLIGGLLAYVATRPNSFRIERSATIQSTPENLHALIRDFRQWEAWSPWENIDPQIRRTYSGANAGVGAIYEWSGNSNIGKGRMEIIESVPPSKVSIQLDFITPFEAHNTVEFSLVAQGKATAVTQAMYGPSPFVSRLMGLFFSMEKMVGEKYEQGLANLKALAEKRAG